MRVKTSEDGGPGLGAVACDRSSCLEHSRYGRPARSARAGLRRLAVLDAGWLQAGSLARVLASRLPL